MSRGLGDVYKRQSQLKDMDRELALLHKTYIRGLGEMKLPVPSYPDANFTIRLTYGNVKPKELSILLSWLRTRAFLIGFLSIIKNNNITMDGAKKLTGLELDNYQYPLADVSHLSEEEKKELFKRGMCIPKQLKSDDEFEQWVSLYALREAQDPYAFSSEGEQVCLDENEKEHLMVDTASYHRAMWYHKKRFSAWAKEELQPLIDELVEAAKTAPQYDWRFLYELEYYKLRCMRAYFSHSLIVDGNGNFGFNKWIDLCILLLQHIKENGIHITENQLQHMNIRNVKDIVRPSLMSNYMDVHSSVSNRFQKDQRAIYERDIYIRKMERLYYKIRLNKLREWWE